MGTIILYSLYLMNAIIAIVYPWIGVLAVYLIGILTPQNIWWWLFPNGRPYYWAVIPLLVGFLFAVFRKRINFSYLKSPLNASVVLLLFTIIVSYSFGQYTHVVNNYCFYDVDLVFMNCMKIYLIYFISICLIDDIKKAKYFTLILTLSICYLIYWSNIRYLSGKVLGRLNGPTGLYGSIYNDENIFAMLFVVGIPFIFYTGCYFQRWYIKFLLWLFIPFGWHAVFLTGSRGGLIGLVISMAMISIRYKNRWVKMALIPTLVVAFLWQGGSIMNERSTTIINYQEDRSAMERIEAWKAALNMAVAHPITGVGLASMGQAYPSFSTFPDVRIAHNTFLQLCAENGIISGLCYLFIIFYSISKLWKSRFTIDDNSIHREKNDETLLFCLNEAVLISIIGFFMCSIFLSLQWYEIFYFLIVLSNFLVIQNTDKRSEVN